VINDPGTFLPRLSLQIETNVMILIPGGVGIGAAITSARKQVGTYLRVNHNTIADANGRGISLYLTITPAWDNTVPPSFPFSTGVRIFSPR